MRIWGGAKWEDLTNHTISEKGFLLKFSERNGRGGAERKKIHLSRKESRQA